MVGTHVSEVQYQPSGDPERASQINPTRVSPIASTVQLRTPRSAGLEPCVGFVVRSGAVCGRFELPVRLCRRGLTTCCSGACPLAGCVG